MERRAENGNERGKRKEARTAAAGARPVVQTAISSADGRNHASTIALPLSSSCLSDRLDYSDHESPQFFFLSLRPSRLYLKTEKMKFKNFNFQRQIITSTL